jgi:putative transcriptional regulator
LITHHPTDATLLEYAAGTLPEALAVVAAVHIAQCTVCRQVLATLEATGGTLLEDVPPVPLEPSAFDRLLARLDQPPRAPPPIVNPHLPEPLNRIHFGRWWPIGIGIWYRPMQAAGAAWGGLILGQPGRALPRHSHSGLEMTSILSGAFADGEGEYYAGDLSEPENHHDQPPRVIGTEPCLCILASEGMQLRGLLGLGQRLIGL